MPYNPYKNDVKEMKGLPKMRHKCKDVSASQHGVVASGLL
jgi:hypothetical protein